MLKKLWKKFYIAFNPFLPWSEAIEADLRKVEYAKAKAAYEVSTEEARQTLACVNRLANWKGPVGHA